MQIKDLSVKAERLDDVRGGLNINTVASGSFIYADQDVTVGGPGSVHQSSPVTSNQQVDERAACGRVDCQATTNVVQTLSFYGKVFDLHIESPINVQVSQDVKPFIVHAKLDARAVPTSADPP